MFWQNGCFSDAKSLDPLDSVVQLDSVLPTLICAVELSAIQDFDSRYSYSLHSLHIRLLNNAWAYINSIKHVDKTRFASQDMGVFSSHTVIVSEK